MYAIAAVVVIGLVLTAERFYYIYIVCNINTEAFTSQIQKLVAANNIERAIKLCNAAPTAALPKVIRAGLAAAGKREAEIDGALRETALEILPRLAARLPVLKGAAATAILLGILGMAVGLVRACAGTAPLAEAGGAPFPAGGLLASMYPLAFGAAAAILFTAVHVFLSRKAVRIATDVELHAQRLRNQLAARVSP
jgi:biopolymer transport protein ExbB/TolQ